MVNRRESAGQFIKYVDVELIVNYFYLFFFYQNFMSIDHAGSNNIDVQKVSLSEQRWKNPLQIEIHISICRVF